MVLDLLSSSICYLGSGVGQAGQGWGRALGFFQSLGRLEQTRGGCLWWIGTAIGRFWRRVGSSWFVNAMQGHCNVNPIFCLLGDFVLLLISSFEFVGMGDNMTRKKKL